MQKSCIFDNKEGEMSLYQDWKKRRKLREEDGGANDYRFNPDNSDFADDYEHLQVELFKSVMNKYQDEAMQFLDGIAQRGDQEIASLLDKLRGKKGMNHMDGDDTNDINDVVPSMADRAHGEEGGGGE